MIDIAVQETEQLAAAIARLVPASVGPLFATKFTHSHMLFDEYVFRLTLRVFAAAGFEPALADWARPEDVVARRGLAPRATVPVDWILRHLAARGVLTRNDSGRFRVGRPLPVLDPAPVRAEQERHDASCLPSYVLAATAAADYPAFLRGERTGEEILFAPTRLPLWVGYFSNDNPLYAVNNRVGAVALETWMPSTARTILELGGGLGSGASAVLDRLAAAGRLDTLGSYRFTELVPAFLRRGQRLLQQQLGDAPFLTFATLDMNRPFAAQGVAPASVSTVYAVNTLHVAHDLAFTLGEIREALEPDGQLIVSECIRPVTGHTTYPEFVFNLLETFRAPRLHPGYRPNGGFLTPEQWTDALVAARFDAVRILPDIGRLREVFPTCYVAALGARRAP